MNSRIAQPVRAATEDSPIQKGASLSEQTYRYVKEMIVSLKLMPGEAIQENQLASELKVSRSPIRYALAKLESEGLIESIPWHGDYVTGITPKYVTEVYQVRVALESYAARLATPNLSRKELEAFREKMLELGLKLEENPNLFYEEHEGPFHDLFVSACNNELLQEMLSSVQDHLRRIRNYVAAVPVVGNVEASFAEHLKILEALLSRDATAAEGAVRTHLENVLERLIPALASSAADSNFVQD